MDVGIKKCAPTELWEPDEFEGIYTAREVDDYCGEGYKFDNRFIIFRWKVKMGDGRYVEVAAFDRDAGDLAKEYLEFKNGQQ